MNNKNGDYKFIIILKNRLSLYKFEWDYDPVYAYI